jgi:hypothetical protein
LGRAKRRARPLWTLQRLCFEPDVAADPSDRGENRHPGTATEAIKMHLTVETQLENAPSQARENVGIVVACGRMLPSVRPPMRQEDSRRPVWEFADRVQFTLSVLEALWKALIVPAPMNPSRGHSTRCKTRHIPHSAQADPARGRAARLAPTGALGAEGSISTSPARAPPCWTSHCERRRQAARPARPAAARSQCAATLIFLWAQR